MVLERMVKKLKNLMRISNAVNPVCGRRVSISNSYSTNANHATSAITLINIRVAVGVCFYHGINDLCKIDSTD